MSHFDRSISISATTDQVVESFPDTAQRILIYNVSGTFVGTLKAQSSPDGATWTDAASRSLEAASPVTDANPTVPGNFSSVMPVSTKYARVVFSAYTSGSARIKTLAIPYV